MTASAPARSTVLGRRAVTLVLLLVALAVGAPSGAASGANRGACAAGEAGAVTVVVDFGTLGGGVDVRCATGLSAASRGSDALAAAGFAWSPPISQPGFVCRLGGRPTADETIAVPGNPSYQESCSGTPPHDAYWSYWKSSGDGNWEYSSSGLTASRVRLGGFEGWSFVTGDQSPPGVSPLSAPEPPAATVAPAPAVTSPNVTPGDPVQPPAERPSTAVQTAEPLLTTTETPTVAPAASESSATSASAVSPTTSSLSRMSTTQPSLSPAIVAASQALSDVGSSSGSSRGFWLFLSGAFAVAGAIVAARRKSRRQQTDAQEHGHRQADDDG